MKKLMMSIAVFFLSFHLYASPNTREIIFFGDSLTDNGNLYRILKVIPRSPPYYKGRFSNGPVWAEHVGNYFKDNFNTDYKIYAVGGATAKLRKPRHGSLPYSIKDEINNYLKISTPGSEDLFVIWIGGNDYINEKSQPVSELTNDVIAETSVNIKNLIHHGARKILILDLPDLGVTPYVRKSDSKDRAARLTTLSQLHHVRLMELTEELQRYFPAVKFMYMDIYQLTQSILLNIEVYNKKYQQHFTNLVDACLAGESPPPSAAYEPEALNYAYEIAKEVDLGKKPCPNPDAYIYWDDLHPSADMHKMLADIITEKLLSTNFVIKKN